MKRDDVNASLRKYAKEKLTPNETERNLVSTLYGAFEAILDGKCFMVGSFRRFTAVHPIHDLDILYVLERLDNQVKDPAQALGALKATIETSFRNPTPYSTRVAIQTHSVTVSFLSRDEEVFAVDIIAAYPSGDRNEFGQDIYEVPEVARIRHRGRQAYYQTLARVCTAMQWIRSDPRGYIELAARVNKKNTDFRKAVKIVKKWKHACCDMNENFKLKSFHIEQVLTGYFLMDDSLDVFGAVFKFFSEISDALISHIPDRAEPNTKIDAYVDDLTPSERRLVFAGRDYVLRTLEDLKPSDSLDQVFSAGFYTRKCPEEKYLFDYQIPVLTDPALQLKIDGKLRPKPGFRNYWLSEHDGRVLPGREIGFEARYNSTGAESLKWKVKNADHCEQPRGEITDHQTLRNPEVTKFPGHHFVECFAIKNSTCIARARQSVVIE